MKLKFLFSSGLFFTTVFGFSQDLPTIIKNGETKLASSNFAGAETDFSTAIRLNNDVVTTYLEKMKKYGTMNEFQKSNSDMPEGFVYNHELAVPYYGHGMSMIGLGKEDDGLADLEKAVTIDPKYADAICERGIVFISKGIKDKGCMDLRKAKSLGNTKAKELYEKNVCSSMSTTFIQSGNTKFEAKDYTGALADYTAAIQLSPDSSEGYIKRGQCNVVLKKYDKAVNDYSKAIKLKPDTITIFYLRGLAYNAASNYKSAFNDFSSVIKLDPNNYDAYMQRGAACEGMENFKSAMYDYSEAIRIRPKDGAAYYKRGIANQDAKDNSACKDFKIASSLGYEDAKLLAEGCGVPVKK
jgi:tetratricopeptide (TPR) repeat protein